MHRNTDCSGLIGYGSCDSLTNPPCGICREFVALLVVELLNSLDKTQVSLLNQVKEKHSSSHISLCYADNKTQVCLCKTLFGISSLIHISLKLFDFFLYLSLFLF